MRRESTRSAFATWMLAYSLAACSELPANPGKIDPSWQPSLLTPEQRRIQPLSARWLVGYWDVSETCSEGGTSLHPNGTYWMDGAYGRWSFAWNTLRIEQLHPPRVHYMQVRLGDPGPSRVKKVGPDSIFVQWPGSPGWTFYRCDPP